MEIKREGNRSWGSGLAWGSSERTRKPELGQGLLSPEVPSHPDPLNPDEQQEPCLFEDPALGVGVLVLPQPLVGLWRRCVPGAAWSELLQRWHFWWKWLLRLGVACAHLKSLLPGTGHRAFFVRRAQSRGCTDWQPSYQLRG